MNRHRVLIADDHLVVREGLKLILESGEQYEIVGEAQNGREAVSLIEELQPDVVLMDLNMPVMGGLEAMKVLQGKGCKVPIIILTTYNEDDLITSGLALGAKGYLLKDTNRDHLFRTISSAILGDTLLQPDILQKVLNAGSGSSQPPSVPDVEPAIELTEKERQVLQFVARGNRNKEIAFDMGISERTVKAHLTSIFNKFGVDSRSQAVAAAVAKGFIHM